MITYAQKSSTVQKVADSKAASLFDSSSQSKSLQRKADMANNAAQRAEAPRPNNTGMPDNLKSGIESLSGFSMDDVRVHYNSSKPATVQALAYTQGTDIHVAPGQEKHLPHEAWHVAQQMAGRVSPTTNINGMPVNDNAGLEHEADVMGEKAVYLKSNLNIRENSHYPKEKCIQHVSAKKNANLKKTTIQKVGIAINGKICMEHLQEGSVKEITTSSPFEKNIKDALIAIKDADYVKKIILAHYLNKEGKPNELATDKEFTMSDRTNGNSDDFSGNWGNISISEGYESAFENGYFKKNDSISVLMNIEQSTHMYFGNQNNAEKKENQTVASTLLHELGHAYQHYLKIKNKSQSNNPSISSDKYPMLYELFLDLKSGNISKVSNAKKILKNALESYFSIFDKVHNVNEKSTPIISNDDLKKLKETKADDIISNIISETDSTKDSYIKKIIDLIDYIGWGSTHQEADGENVFLNEIYYNLDKKLGTRNQYLDAVDLNRTTLINFIREKTSKELFDVEESDLNKTNMTEIMSKAQDLDLFLNPVMYPFWVTYITKARKEKYLQEEIQNAKYYKDIKPYLP